MNVYVSNEWFLLVLIVGAFVVVFLTAAGVCAVVNRIAGRQVMLPWVWGGVAAGSWFVLAVAYHFVMVYRTTAAP